jgi:hypothetical protein
MFGSNAQNTLFQNGGTSMFGGINGGSLFGFNTRQNANSLSSGFFANNIS